MSDPRDRQQDQARILQGLLDQGDAPVETDDTPDQEVEMQPDGSAIVREPDDKPADTKFYRNLADDLDDTQRQSIATRLLQLIESDKTAREKRDKQYQDGLKRMGLADETIGGANFTGASVVTHPMYTEACIDFEARVIKELMPPTGPCREFVPGTITDDKSDKAHRKAKWMNYLFLHKMPDFHADMEQLLMQLPMGGNQYMKILPPRGTRKFTIGHEWIPVDQMLLPEDATSYTSATRRTQIAKVNAYDFADRIREGVYRDIKASNPNTPEDTATEEAAKRIDGVESTQDNVDGLRVVYECDCYFEIPVVETQPDMAGDPNPKPYLISIDQSTREVLSIYRNWDKDDDDFERLEWVAPFGFIPFRGAYWLGLPHIIGGLSIAATGSLRALLDTAHINNTAGLIKLKGAAGTGQTITISPTQVTELEGSGEVDDIRKLIMALPFGPPSPVLFQLLGFLDTKASSVIRTTLDNPEDNANVPVGTQMMRVEQGLVVFSSIHRRLHVAMDALLKIIHRICRTYLEDADVENELGEQLVTRADFEGPNDVLPASDPNIFCELQRYSQAQTVAQRAAQMPAVYDQRKVEEFLLKLMRLPNDGKDLLIAKPEPSQMNPVNENIALVFNRPIVAFPEQDHDAHIESHCAFYENPMFQGLAQGTAQGAMALSQHLKEHIAFWYGMQVHKLASTYATAEAKKLDPNSKPIDIGDLPQKADGNPAIAQRYDAMLTAASAHVMQMAAQDKSLQRAVQTIQKLAQLIAQQQPPQPMDPSQALMAETSRKAEKDKADTQLKAQDLQQRAQESRGEAQSEIQRTAMQDDAALHRQQESDQTKLAVTAHDNATALEIATQRALSGVGTNVKDGEAIGKGAPHV